MRQCLNFLPVLAPHFENYGKVLVTLDCFMSTSDEPVSWCIYWENGVYATDKSYQSIIYEIESEMAHKTFLKLSIYILIDDRNFMDTTIYNFY